MHSVLLFLGIIHKSMISRNYYWEIYIHFGRAFFLDSQSKLCIRPYIATTVFDIFIVFKGVLRPYLLCS
jgi:hypothetical protein